MVLNMLLLGFLMLHFVSKPYTRLVDNRNEALVLVNVVILCTWMRPEASYISADATLAIAAVSMTVQFAAFLAASLGDIAAFYQGLLQCLQDTSTRRMKTRRMSVSQAHARRQSWSLALPLSPASRMGEGAGAGRAERRISEAAVAAAAPVKEAAAPASAGPAHTYAQGGGGGRGGGASLSDDMSFAGVVAGEGGLFGGHGHESDTAALISFD
jgi:hypothetical protein